MSLCKSLLAPALAGLALIVAIWAPAARAGDLYVPTYGYAAQHYGTPRACCGAPPCCVRAQPYAPQAYGYYDDRRAPAPCRDPRACRPCDCVGEITLGPGFDFDGGVGPIPEGGYGGGGYAVMDGGGFAGGSASSSARASASAYASASSHVSVRIGGGGHGGHGGGRTPGCGCGGGHH
ncbi:hypothetical protein [Phenylobacterium aquaticum]|uniref:hypothetical protein n=1 Tax=Phenylobacterium aquaticum TaxID=1763816 RepID=UPI001F5C4F01|nr:hypothetical protein [Phenylobacterium aquaticum]MCI3135126.1 hypothetical protein [Phenylobacterium aquaticum]